jgi:hypothetical protein
MSVTLVTNTVSDIYVAPNDGLTKPSDGLAVTGVLSAEAITTPGHDGHIHLICDLNKIFSKIDLEVPVTDAGDVTTGQGVAGTYANSSDWLTTSNIGDFIDTNLYEPVANGSFGATQKTGTCTECFSVVCEQLYKQVIDANFMGQIIDEAKVSSLLDAVTHLELWTTQQYQDLADKLVVNSSKFQYDVATSKYKTNFATGDKCRLYTNIVDQSRPVTDEPSDNKFQLLWTFEHLDASAYPNVP